MQVSFREHVLVPEPFILVALIAASRLTERLKSYYAKRTVLRLLEAGWVKWTAELEAQESAAAAPSVPPLKQVA